jgi:uncharacterized protein (DUF433 family)
MEVSADTRRKLRSVAKPRAIGHYSAAEVGRLAGVSARRIGQWARYGLIPSVSAKPRIYSYADAGEAVLVRYLISQKYTTAEVRRIVEQLREEFGTWPLAAAPLEHDGKLTVLRKDGEVFISVDRPDHEVMGETFLNLKIVREALWSGGWVAYVNNLAHIEVDPERLSGRPTLRGRRLATEVVAELAQLEGGREDLRDEYGLTDEEIDSALAYESAVSAAVA